MAILQMVLFAGLASSSGADSFDCEATAHRFAEMSRKIRAETDLNVEYAIGMKMTEIVGDLYPRRRTCLVSDVLPILTDLADDPDANKAYYAALALGELGADAKPALPVLRRAASRAKLDDDARIAQLVRDYGIAVGGAGLEDTIRLVIGSVDDSHDSTPIWREGLCYRVERRYGPASPVVELRVVSNEPDSGACDSEVFGRSRSWTYSGPFGADESTTSPANLLAAWSALSKLIDQEVHIWQICPVSTRAEILINPILADSNLRSIEEDEGTESFDATFEFRDESKKRIVYVGFKFSSARGGGVQDFRAIECGSRPIP